MFEYMQNLRYSQGYVSLTTMHLELESINFPSLYGKRDNIANSMDDDQITDDTEHIVAPINPIAEKDNKMEKMEKQISALETKVAKHQETDEELLFSKEKLERQEK